MNFTGVTSLKTLSESARFSTDIPESVSDGQCPTFSVVFVEASLVSVTHCTVLGETRVSKQVTFSDTYSYSL